MNDSTSGIPNAPSGDDNSGDHIEFFNMDGPADMTVRPMHPKMVQFIREKEERRARLMELWKQQLEEEKAKESSRTETRENNGESNGP